ncbi:glutaredoxin family protein [Virgibacillus sediminis]|uniref:Glutaredoxin family protein n=1 Tax=Virgibacillus sediminis TaxID=202260 RepID=A0ABV7A514_9BACI
MNSITVFTTTQCPYCVMLKSFLTAQNVDFEEVNVEQNPEIMQQLVAETGQMGVPQSRVNGQWVVGFDPDAIVGLLKK